MAFLQINCCFRSKEFKKKVSKTLLMLFEELERIFMIYESFISFKDH